jgi:acetolactate synthase-1/2/3 large subunit
MYTTSTAFLEALVEAGVSHIFVNLGSDHPALLEAIAEARVHGRKIPNIVTTPHEMVGLSAAQGHAQVSGQAQAVIVHVECGTQNLGGAIHNAAKSRTPALIFAGESPYTQEGELMGSRNEFIQWIQNVHDQRGIVRGYMKYDNEIRTGANVKQLVHRAMQMAHSDPQGPVYLMGAREAMEQEAKPVVINQDHWRPTDKSPLSADFVKSLADDLANAKRPMVVTSYVGRNTAAVPELVRLCERLGVGVHESVPSAMNFPMTHPMHQGVQWNDRFQNPHIEAADVILVVNCDVPWIPLFNKPSDGARIYHVDVDVLKEQMPLFYLPAFRRAQADPATALAQVNAYLDANPVDQAKADERIAHYTGKHDAWQAGLRKNEAKPTGEYITVPYLAACIRAHVDADTIVMNESITNDRPMYEHLGMTTPGSLFTAGAGSLGWNGGAAIGAKLAAPDKTVIAISGDGCYLFSSPSVVHWMAKSCETPFLQIVLNNRGWRAPKFSMLGVHPDGYASKANDINVSFESPPDYAGIAAAAGGAYARTVRSPDEVEAALAEAMHAVKVEKRCAVLDVWLEHL